MATPSTPSHRADSRQPSSTQGGASSQPTPANNSGGGSGWGDPGFFKGGSNGHEGAGHAPALNARSTIGGFLGLTDQKTEAEKHYQGRFDQATGVREKTKSGAPTCESEDHSFMEHRPGCSATLPGWDAAKSVVNT
ncbi:hypothetical protein ASPZODRAFT_17528 [Penicilliopsis zonata CBS 506.65]|uniref:Uncharacterized protein n=1 Tax=Penicilliopsis zonata CBS 506.65 TaxID=1073090 RepID=A0A1L9SDQ4_9EURO|nr:hypothetical protein ASPZODRAFT_17528 [Penicilliopsis zonata CBS 506.65]OJJ45311.1 hypothetical protein ASPZODRAFT_17528 [Penicilliopsis zonata CBS 506.65]